MRILPMMAAIALAVSTNAAVANENHDKEMGNSTHGMDNMEGMEVMNNEQTVGQQLSGKGMVKAIDTEAQTITITHEPIPALQWPTMTMKFNLDNFSLTQEIEVNDQVEFEFVRANGNYVITAIKPQE